MHAATAAGTRAHTMPEPEYAEYRTAPNNEMIARPIADCAVSVWDLFRSPGNTSPSEKRICSTPITVHTGGGRVFLAQRLDRSVWWPII